MSYVSKYKSSFLGALLTCFVIFDGGCGTWIGNPKDPDEETESNQGVVTLKFASQVPTTNLLAAAISVTDSQGANIGTLSLTEAKVVLKEIKLVASSGLALKESSDSDYEFDGPYIVNLLSNSFRPNPDEVSVEAQTYDRIKLKLAKLEEDAASTVGIGENDSLYKKSIYLKGTYLPNTGDDKPFVLSFDIDEEFELRDSISGIDVTQGVTNPVIISFNLASWFTFSSKETNSDGFDFNDLTGSEIILTKDSEETAKKIREVIKENIKVSAEFGKDDDEDGRLDEDE